MSDPRELIAAARKQRAEWPGTLCRELAGALETALAQAAAAWKATDKALVEKGKRGSALDAAIAEMAKLRDRAEVAERDRNATRAQPPPICTGSGLPKMEMMTSGDCGGTRTQGRHSTINPAATITMQYDAVVSAAISAAVAEARARADKYEAVLRHHYVEKCRWCGGTGILCSACAPAREVLGMMSEKKEEELL